MRDQSSQGAVHALANFLTEFIDNRRWDCAGCKAQVTPSSCNIGNSWLEYHGERTEKANIREDGRPKWGDRFISDRAFAAIAYLCKEVTGAAGQTVWGLTFTLYPDGKFNIEYDYERPDWYAEEDERADAEHSTLDASAANALGLRLNSFGAEIEIVDFKPDSPVSVMLSEALSWLRGQTERLGDSWGLGSETAWNLDMNEGTLRFSFADGREVTCPVQVIGTYDTTDSSFLWGWDHPSVPEPLRRAARQLHESGMYRELEAFANRVTFCSEADAWAYTAAAAKLDEAIGAYRGRSGDTWVYMSIASPC